VLASRFLPQKMSGSIPLICLFMAVGDVLDHRLAVLSVPYKIGFPKTTCCLVRPKERERHVHIHISGLHSGCVS